MIEKLNNLAITETIIMYAKALVPDGPWQPSGLIFEQVLKYRPDNPSNSILGRSVILHNLAPVISVVASGMDWDIKKSPEVRYMSGYYFGHQTGIYLEMLDRRLIQAETNTRRFETPEGKATVVEKERGIIALLSKFKTNMEEALDKLAVEHLPDADYTEILAALIYMKLDERKKRPVIIGLVRQGQINEAHVLLTTPVP